MIDVSFLTKQLVIDDSELVEKAKAGDCDAFGELVRRYQLEVRAFLRRRIHNFSVADDLAQEVFLGAMKSIENMRNAGSVRSWLFSIARFKMIDYLRSEKKRKSNSAELELALELESIRQIEDGAVDGEVVEVLKDCIEKLRPEAKSVLNQYYFDDLGANEIARSSKQKPSTVRMTLLRIRRALGKCIRKCMGDKFEL